MENWFGDDWKPSELENLKIGFDEGLSDRDLAQRLGRTIYAVEKRRLRLGYKRNKDKTLEVNWRPEEVERLKELAALDWSYGKIAEDLGRTRGSVIGKADRIGLPGRPRVAKAENRRKRPRSNTVRRNPYTWKRKPEYFEYPAAETVIPQQVRLIDLESHHCRYPLDSKDDDGLILYCGNPKYDNQSYCLGHCAICFEELQRGRGYRGFRQSALIGRTFPSRRILDPTF